jgi:hypothetical protein
MPRRPERTSERNDPDELAPRHRPQRHPPARIFSERQLTRAVQQISVTLDRVHLRHLLDGRVVTWFRFAPADVAILERAIELSRSAHRIMNAGRVPLPLFGSTHSYIDVGGGRGVICARMVIQGIKRDKVLLDADEVRALTQAISHFKTTAARAAI